MKKTLLLLMGSCLAFFPSVACLQESKNSTKSDASCQDHSMAYKFMAASALASTIKSGVRKITGKVGIQSRLKGSPTSVTRKIDQEVESSYTTAESSDSESEIVDKQDKKVKFFVHKVVHKEADLASLQEVFEGLSLLQPSELVRQSSLSDSSLHGNNNHPTPPIKPYLDRSSSSNLEILTFMRQNSSNGLFRVHSSESLYCDHLTPDLGKTPESDAGLRIRSTSDDTQRSRSDSSSSDWALYHSPHSKMNKTQRQRLGVSIRQYNLTPDIGEESPRSTK